MPVSRPAVLFVESNTTGTGRLFVDAARKLDYRPILLTARPEKYPYLSGAGAPEVIVVPRIDVTDLCGLIQRRFGPGELAGITSSSEYFIVAAAALAARFDLPGPDPARITAARDKSNQRQVLAAAGLPTPAFRVVSSVAAATAAACEIGFPIVVKPIDRSGSVGVRLCADVRDVDGHASALFGRDRHDRILVESLITGDEFSVEVFAGRAIGITRKHLGSLPCFVETGHDYPGDPPHSALLLTVVERATALFGLDWGPIHWELRVHEGRAYVIEVNPRLAGGFIPELVRRAQGIDLIRETVRVVTSGQPDLEPRHRKHASIRFLLAPAAGRLAAVEGTEQARAVDAVVDVASYRSPGEELKVTGDFNDRIGHVITCGAQLEATAAAAERARDLVRVQLEPGRAVEALELDAASVGTSAVAEVA